MKKFLFIISCPVYQGVQPREILDQLMVMGAFEQQVAVLFTDDAVFQLSANQAPDIIHSVHIGKWLQALPLYDIDTFFVESESLDERGMSVDNLVLPVKTIHRCELSSLLNQYHQVVNC